MLVVREMCGLSHDKCIMVLVLHVNLICHSLDSISGDSSSLRPPKVSRIEGTPPSSVISDNSDDESPAPPPVRRSLRRHAAPES